MYRLDCECGSFAVVTPGQSGGTIACPSCAKQLRIPQLRDLKSLPLAPSQTVTRESRWTTARGATFSVLLVIALILGTTGFVNVARYQQSPPGMTPAEVVVNSREAIGTMNSMQLLQLWEMYEGAGLDPRQLPPEYQNLLNRQRYRNKAIGFLIPAGLFLLAAVGYAVMIGKRPAHNAA